MTITTTTTTTQQRPSRSHKQPEYAILQYGAQVAVYLMDRHQRSIDIYTNAVWQQLYDCWLLNYTPTEAADVIATVINLIDGPL
jgi:hypothetical protein